MASRNWYVRAERCSASLLNMKKGSWFLVASLIFAKIIHFPPNWSAFPIVIAIIGIIGSIFQIGWCVIVYIPTIREVKLTEPLNEIENRILHNKSHSHLRDLRWHLFYPNMVSLLFSGAIIWPLIKPFCK